MEGTGVARDVEEERGGGERREEASGQQLPDWRRQLGDNASAELGASAEPGQRGTDAGHHRAGHHELRRALERRPALRQDQEEPQSLMWRCKRVLAYVEGRVRDDGRLYQISHGQAVLLLKQLLGDTSRPHRPGSEVGG